MPSYSLKPERHATDSIRGPWTAAFSFRLAPGKACQPKPCALQNGGEQFCPFDRRELALMEPLRTLLLIHCSAWLARRLENPIVPINVP